MVAPRVSMEAAQKVNMAVMQRALLHNQSQPQKANGDLRLLLRASMAAMQRALLHMQFLRANIAVMQ